MRIHAFLEHWGIINYAAKGQLIAPGRHPSDLILKFNEQGNPFGSPDKLDLFDFDKTLIPKAYNP